jgi:hypothetical protein
LGRSAQFEITRRRTESVESWIDFRRLLFSLQFLSASITVGSHSRPVHSTHTFPHKPSRCGDLAITYCMNRQQNCSLSILLIDSRDSRFRVQSKKITTVSHWGAFSCPSSLGPSLNSLGDICACHDVGRGLLALKAIAVT